MWGGVEVGVYECGKAWHILDTGGSVHVGVQELVCVCVWGGEGHISYDGGVCTWRCSVCVCEE